MNEEKEREQKNAVGEKCHAFVIIKCGCGGGDGCIGLFFFHRINDVQSRKIETVAALQWQIGCDFGDYLWFSLLQFSLIQFEWWRFCSCCYSCCCRCCCSGPDVRSCTNSGHDMQMYKRIRRQTERRMCREKKCTLP